MRLPTDTVRQAQAAVAAFAIDWPGMDPGPIDGLFGDKSQLALHAWQRGKGLLIEQGGPLRYPGTLGPTTLRAFGIEVPVIEAPDDSPSYVLEDAPPWVAAVFAIEGLHERRDNAALKAWLKSDGRTLGDPKVLPWCGDLVETAFGLTLEDEPMPGALGKNPYWARNWALFGLEDEGPSYGAVAVFKRGSGGHVGFVVGVSPGGAYVYVLGGNQSNAVNVMRLKASRLLGYRWPSTYEGPRVPAPKLIGTGTRISRNEA